MIFSPPPRNLRAELLDLDEAPFEEVRDSLRDVQRVNKYLSGYRVLLQHIAGCPALLHPGFFRIPQSIELAKPATICR